MARAVFDASAIWFRGHGHNRVTPVLRQENASGGTGKSRRAPGHGDRKADRFLDRSAFLSLRDHLSAGAS